MAGVVFSSAGVVVAEGVPNLKPPEAGVVPPVVEPNTNPVEFFVLVFAGVPKVKLDCVVVVFALESGVAGLLWPKVNPVPADFAPKVKLVVVVLVVVVLAAVEPTV